MLRMIPRPSLLPVLSVRTWQLTAAGRRPRGEAVRQGPSTEGGSAGPRGVSLPFTMVYCAAPLFRLFHRFCNWGIVGG